MSAYDFDLFVIGAGSGGVRAARIAAGHGAKVAVAEEYRVGGTCVLRGCIPKKLLVYGAHVAAELADAAAYGWRVAPAHHDWPALIAAKDKELDRLNRIYIGLLENAGVAILQGRAVLAGPHAVTLDGRRMAARVILVATGSWPVKPAIPGAEHAITSNEALELARRPERIVIVGGGYIAVEFAGIFRGFGSTVALLYRGERILRGFDGDVRAALAEELRRQGIDLRLHTLPAAIERTEGGLLVKLTDGGRIEADQVMFATGRDPNTGGLGLAEAGVALAGNGAVAVDEYSRSSVPSIYAVGDVTDRLNLTPVALAEGHAFADTVFGGRPRRVVHAGVPSAVFSQPPIGTVGLSEEAARAQGYAVRVFRSRFTPLKHTLTGKGEKTMMKLVVDARSDRVLGAHMVGADAPEIIQGVAVALSCGATKAQFDATLGIHPTAAEEFVTMRSPVAEPAAKAAE